MLALVCGMQTEANILNNPTGTIVIQGRNKDSNIQHALEVLIAQGAVDAIMSVGVCGALDTVYNAGDIVVGTAVVYAENVIKCADPWWKDIFHNVKNLAQDKAKAYVDSFTWSPAIVSTATEKNSLLTSTLCGVVDQETYLAAQIAQKHNLPFAVLRTVSDPANFSLPPAALVAMNQNNSIDFEAIIASLDKNDLQILDLIKLASYSTEAFNSLAWAIAQLGINFARD